MSESKAPSDSANADKPRPSRIHLRPSPEPAPADITPTFSVTYGGRDNLEKLRKNPLVPLGALGTGAVLVAGLLAFRSGNTRLSQSLMRARVLAQGATLVMLSLSVANMRGAAAGSAGLADAAAEGEQIPGSIEAAPLQAAARE